MDVNGNWQEGGVLAEHSVPKHDNDNNISSSDSSVITSSQHYPEAVTFPSSFPSSSSSSSALLLERSSVVVAGGESGSTSSGGGGETSNINSLSERSGVVVSESSGGVERSNINNSLSERRGEVGGGSGGGERSNISNSARAGGTAGGMTKDAPDTRADLPSQDHAKEFYAKYEPRNILGKGISSTVRRVIEKSTQKEYAVKIVDISGEHTENPAAVVQCMEETRREVNILYMCAGHPNIIELHDYFQTETFLFLVFELCRRGELFDYLTSEVSLSEKRTRFFMHQLLKVVAFLHAQNIVHRDLKPENILLDDNLNIKVSDFGFATVLEENEQLSELLGTPGYLAPETLKAATDETNTEGYGKEVDLWACGVIMYTLLCGGPPFWHRKQMLMLRAIMDGRYSFASPIWNDVSESSKNLISRLLVVDPKERLTAQQALQHPFFERELVPEKKFMAKKVFKAAVLAIQFFFRMKRFHLHPPPVELGTVMDNPYQVRQFRRLVDGCAFGMYAHWVKKGENQNRAALFEHTKREDWKRDCPEFQFSVEGESDRQTPVGEGGSTALA